MPSVRGSSKILFPRTDVWTHAALDTALANHPLPDGVMLFEMGTNKPHIVDTVNPCKAMQKDRPLQGIYFDVNHPVTNANQPMSIVRYDNDQGEGVQTSRGSSGTHYLGLKRTATVTTLAKEIYTELPTGLLPVPQHTSLLDRLSTETRNMPNYYANASMTQRLIPTIKDAFVKMHYNFALGSKWSNAGNAKSLILRLQLLEATVDGGGNLKPINQWNKNHHIEYVSVNNCGCGTWNYFNYSAYMNGANHGCILQVKVMDTGYKIINSNSYWFLRDMSCHYEYVGESTFATTNLML